MTIELHDTPAAVACSNAHPKVVEDVMEVPAVPVNEIVAILHGRVMEIASAECTVADGPMVHV